MLPRRLHQTLPAFSLLRVSVCGSAFCPSQELEQSVWLPAPTCAFSCWSLHLVTRSKVGLSVNCGLFRGLFGVAPASVYCLSCSALPQLPNLTILLCWTQRCPVFKLCPPPIHPQPGTSSLWVCLASHLGGTFEASCGCLVCGPQSPGVALHLSRACPAVCLFMIVDEREATSSVLSLPLTHFGCGLGRSLFFTIKSHTVAGHPLQETPRWPIFSVLSEELVSEQLTGTQAVSWPQARVPLGPGPRDSQGPKVAEGEQEPWAAGWRTVCFQLQRVLPLGEPGGHRP